MPAEMQMECFDCQPRVGLAAEAQEQPASAETGNTGSSLHADLCFILCQIQMFCLIQSK